MLEWRIGSRESCVRVLRTAAVILSLFGSSACAGLPGLASGAGPRATAERARAQLIELAVAGDEAGVRALLGDDVRLVHAGAELHGSAAVAARLVSIAADTLRRPGALNLYGTFGCTAALQEWGAYVQDRPGDSFSLGRFRFLWRTRPDGTTVLEDAVFDEWNLRAPERPCRAVADSTFRSRQSWIAVHGVAAARDGDALRGRVDRALVDIGYDVTPTTASEAIRNRKRGASQILPAVFVTVPVWQDIGVDAQAGEVAGRSMGAAPGPRWVLLDYRARMAGAGPTIAVGPLQLAAGAVLVRADGEWDRFDQVFAAESWSTWAVGGSAGAAFKVPVGSWLGAELRATRRFIPDITVPGFAGSDPLTVNLSHWSLSAGFGARFW